MKISGELLTFVCFAKFWSDHVMVKEFEAKMNQKPIVPSLSKN